jgi:hypothetical protein
MGVLMRTVQFGQKREIICFVLLWKKDLNDGSILSVGKRIAAGERRCSIRGWVYYTDELVHYQPNKPLKKEGRKKKAINNASSGFNPSFNLDAATAI